MQREMRNQKSRFLCRRNKAGVDFPRAKRPGEVEVVGLKTEGSPRNKKGHPHHFSLTSHGGLDPSDSKDVVL